MRIHALLKRNYLLLVYPGVLIAFVVTTFFESSSDLLSELPSSQFSTLKSKILFNVFFVGVFFILNLILLKTLRYKVKILQSLSAKKTKVFIVAIWTLFAFIPSVISGQNLRSMLSNFFYLFGVGHLYPNFVDLRGTLAAISDVKEVGQSFSIKCDVIDEPCLGWRWTYGSMILNLHRVPGLIQENAPFFAILFFLVFIKILYNLIQTNLDALIFLLLLVSGTSLLTIERMNIDILTLPLFYAISKLNQRNLIFRLTTVLAWLFFSLTKYYTFPLILVIVLILKSKREKLFAILLTAYFIPTVLRDLGQARLEEQVFGYAATTGISIISGFLEGSKMPNFQIFTTSGTLTVVSFILLCLIFRRLYRNKLGVTNADSSTKYLFLLVILNLVTCWIISESYPYRLISTLALVPVFTSTLRERQELLFLNIFLLYAVFAGIHISLTFTRNLFFAILIASLIGMIAELVGNVVNFKVPYLPNRGKRTNT